MSANRNTDALANQAQGGGSGEFSSKRAADEPMMSGGHQPGKLVGNETIPEFEAKTLPPGSAPASNTFQPNVTPGVGDSANSRNDADLVSEQTSATTEMPGATSGDVHTGIGHPGSGQSSAELRHDGQSGRKNPGASLEGVGAGAPSTKQFKSVDERDPKFAEHRTLDKDEAVTGRGTVGGPPAQEREPVSAEQVASARK